MTENYLFGDTDLAARRLKVLANTFGASSRLFMAEAADRPPRLAVDLGCGPGYTTHLLADALACTRTVGLDNSEPFIALAEKTATDRVSFHVHDVTTVPFPVGPCDLIYARFLLTHQAEPETLIPRWTTQLAPGGRLALEEVESIRTEEAAFNEYLQIVDAMLTDGGHDLYVGPRIDTAGTPAGAVRRSSRVVRLPVTNDVAAKMFSMNIRTWKDNAFVRQHCSPASIRKLEERLTQLAATPTRKKGIEWRLRQLVYEREK